MSHRPSGRSHNWSARWRLWQGVRRRAVRRRALSTILAREASGQPSGDPEQLGRLAQIRHFRGGLALRGVECLLVAVDPDDRDALLDAGRYVGVVAGGDVYPALLGAQAPGALDEVGRV